MPETFHHPEIGDYWLEDSTNFPHIGGDLHVKKENWHNYHLYCLQTGFTPTQVYGDAVDGDMQELKRILEGNDNNAERNYETLKNSLVDFIKERESLLLYINEDYFLWKESIVNKGGSLWEETPPQP